MWTTTAGLFCSINGVTQQYASLAGTNTFTQTTFFTGGTFSIQTTASQTVNIGSGVTASGNSKTVNIGTNGAAGSNTNITIGTVNGALISVRGTSTTFDAGHRATVSHTASSAGLRVSAVATALNTIVAGDIWHDSTAGLLQIQGYSNSMRSAMTACRAFVNFNGTGTVAIRASYNVSSITDNGVGDYTINFTNALVDANYSVTTGNVGATLGDTSRTLVVAGVIGTGATLKSTTQLRVQSGLTNSVTLADSAELSIAIFR
jgi:hypothetical protein